MRAAFVRLGETFRSLREFRQAFLLLAAFLIYNDGIQTIIKMATAYGAEIGIPDSAMMLAILIVQFVGVPCAFLFGALAGRIGAKPAILLGLVVYTLISIVGYHMRTAGQFFVLAAMVGPGAGRHPGAEPFALRLHDARPQVGGVLRLLQRLREVRRHLRARSSSRSRSG